MFETPIYAIKNLLLKLENFNLGGSHKSRSARWMIQRALATNVLTSGKEIILEKTGGNLGIGLAIEAAKYSIPVELAVGLNFSARKKSLLKKYGATLIGDGMMRDGALPKDVISFHLDNQKKMGKSYVFLDQFKNPANVDAHFWETGPEISRYIKSNRLCAEKIILVGGVGSGASVSGTGLALKANFPNVEIVAVQPKGCDIVREIFVEHPMQGIAVGVTPSILRSDIVDRWISCSANDAITAQEWLLKKHGIYAGLSTGGNIHVARGIAQADQRNIIVTFVYDSGESYE